MDFSDLLYVTDIGLDTLIRRAYGLSSTKNPDNNVNTPAELDDETLEMNKATRRDEGDVECIRIQAIYGRIVSLDIFFDGDDIYIPNVWKDHTDEQLDQLIQPVEEPLP